MSSEQITLSDDAAERLIILAMRGNPWKKMGKVAAASLLELRHYGLIDQDGKITDAGKKVVRLGADKLSSNVTLLDRQEY